MCQSKSFDFKQNKSFSSDFDHDEICHRLIVNLYRNFLVARFFFVIFIASVTTQNIFAVEATLLDDTGNEVPRRLVCPLNDCDEKCGNIPGALRFDCHPEDGASQLACTDRGCCWDPTEYEESVLHKRRSSEAPFCFYPENWVRYKYENWIKIGNNFTGHLKRRANSFYDNNLLFINIATTCLDESILRVKVRLLLVYRYRITKFCYIKICFSRLTT